MMQGFDHFVTADQQCVIVGYDRLVFSSFKLFLCSCVRVDL